jgi:hypothetical protein
VCGGGGGVRIIIRSVDISNPQYPRLALLGDDVRASRQVRVSGRAVARFGGPESADVEIDAPCDDFTANVIMKACGLGEPFDVAAALLAAPAPNKEIIREAAEAALKIRAECPEITDEEVVNAVASLTSWGHPRGGFVAIGDSDGVPSSHWTVAP